MENKPIGQYSLHGQTLSSNTPEQEPLLRQKRPRNDKADSKYLGFSSVQIDSQKASQSLLFRLLISKVNDVLENELEIVPLDTSLDTHDDLAPEQLADHVMKISAELFDTYIEQHEASFLDESREQFISLLSEAIHQAFEHTRELLDRLHVVEDDVINEIDETYDLLKEGLDNFVSQSADNDFDEDHYLEDEIASEEEYLALQDQM